MTPLQNRFLSLAIVLLISLPGFSQFKKVYLPDSTTFSTVGLFSAKKIIYTGIPGREIALTGGLTGVDTSGTTVQPAYMLQMSAIGVPKKFSYYTDLSPFALQRARGFDLCYDGAGNFYIATGANDNPVVIRTNLDGEMIWAMDGNHHDYYTVICEGATMYMMGQDESFLGAHDFSIHELDSSGNAVVGRAYGTTNFDQPEAMARIPDGFIMVGSSSSSNGFRGMVVKATNSNDLAWGSPYEVPGRQAYMSDVATLGADGVLISGYLSGISGGPDSVFVTRMDTSGGVQWMHTFGTDQSTQMVSTTIAYDAIGDRILLAGYFKASAGYNKPFAMLLDGSGDYLWSRSYGDYDSSVEELPQDVAISDDGMDFYVVGGRVKVASPLVRSGFVIKAAMNDGLIPCDSAVVMGQASGELVATDVVFTEQILSNTPYPYQLGGGEMEQSVMCSVMVGLDQPLPTPVAFEVVSPTTGQLSINYDLVYSSAELELVDLQGRVLKRVALDGGRHERDISLGEMAAGVYLVRLKGDDWVSPTRKILIY